MPRISFIAVFLIACGVEGEVSPDFESDSETQMRLPTVEQLKTNRLGDRRIKRGPKRISEMLGGQEGEPVMSDDGSFASDPAIDADADGVDDASPAPPSGGDEDVPGSEDTGDTGDIDDSGL